MIVKKRAALFFIVIKFEIRNVTTQVIFIQRREASRQTQTKHTFTCFEQTLAANFLCRHNEQLERDDDTQINFRICNVGGIENKQIPNRQIRDQFYNAILIFER